MVLIDLTGRTFGRLLILGRDPNCKTKDLRWLWRCSCGKEGSSLGCNLRSGVTTSCGCYRAEAAAAFFTTHGQNSGGVKSPALQSWGSMWTRVTNRNEKTYKDYGGRGITVCERWRKFENFFADMGERPEGLTLERRDVNGNYEPSNCYWADSFTQANNKRGLAKWLIDSQLMTKAQARRHWGVSAYVVKKRLSTLPLAEGEAPKWMPQCSNNPDHEKEK